MPEPPEDNLTWLQKTAYEQTMTTYASVWDLYIKFYTIFLTANVAGLGIVLEYVPKGNRWPIAIAFGLENVLTAFSSWGVAEYSKKADKRVKEIAKNLTKDSSAGTVPEAALASPSPGDLAVRSGWVNVIACVLHIGFWIAICFINNDVKGVNDKDLKDKSSAVSSLSSMAISNTPGLRAGEGSEILQSLHSR